jgi:hypothetical protein
MMTKRQLLHSTRGRAGRRHCRRHRRFPVRPEAQGYGYLNFDLKPAQPLEPCASAAEPTESPEPTPSTEQEFKLLMFRNWVGMSAVLLFVPVAFLFYDCVLALCMAAAHAWPLLAR